MARILLVEDDATMAAILRELLESEQHAVSHALDGVIALQYMGVTPSDEIQSQIPGINWTNSDLTMFQPDLVLTDCMMPRMDGLTLVKAMLQDDRVRKIPVIALTTKGKMEEPFLQLSNVVNFVQKPPYPDALLAMIKKALPSAPAA